MCHSTTGCLQIVSQLADIEVIENGTEALIPELEP